MKRTRKHVGGLALVGVVGAIGVGCTVGLPVPDQKATPEVTPTPSASTSDAGRDRVEPPAPCPDEQSALAIKGVAPTAGANKCTPALLGELKTKCLATGATGCDAFVEANKDCARCVLGALMGDTPETTPLPALIPVSQDSVSPNVAACAALVLGKPDCAIKLTQQVVCTQTACSTCTEAGDTDCAAKALDGICKTTVDKACNDAINAAAAQWQPICKGTAFDDTYVKVASYMCGAGSTSIDGGATDAGGGD